ncbi:MAG: histidinol-phosphate transaminase [Pedosphaera sp.]|nr:histidinol-phosphate transaminase [Pedosphaera sp.]MSU43862.1 histidinol-phosphate transaminase [Pedosphaera sp.]
MALPDRLNPTLKHLPVYQPGRPLEEVAREIGAPVESIIKLASNENPLGPSPLAIKAMTAASAAMHRYPDGNAFYLRQRLARHLSVQTTNLIFGNGSNEILEFVARALLGPGDEVVMSQYCFAIYPIVTLMMGAKVVAVPAKDFGHDLPAMLRAVTPKTKIVFVANPNNPTGTLAPAQDVLQLLRGLPEDVLLVMDEAYIEFLDAPLDLLPEIREGRRHNLLLMRTFSKIYGLAGLRVGYGVGHTALVSAMEVLRQPFNLNAMAQAAAMAALEDTPHVLSTREQNRTGLAFLVATLEQHGLEHVPSHANFILAKVGDGQRVFEAMQRLGIIVRPMGSYALPEWIRISVGSDAENRRCIAALRQALGLRED